MYNLKRLFLILILICFLGTSFVSASLWDSFRKSVVPNNEETLSLSPQSMINSLEYYIRYDNPSDVLDYSGNYRNLKKQGSSSSISSSQGVCGYHSLQSNPPGTFTGPYSFNLDFNNDFSLVSVFSPDLDSQNYLHYISGVGKLDLPYSKNVFAILYSGVNGLNLGTLSVPANKYFVLIAKENSPIAYQIIILNGQINVGSDNSVVVSKSGNNVEVYVNGILDSSTQLTVTGSFDTSFVAGGSPIEYIIPGSIGTSWTFSGDKKIDAFFNLGLGQQDISSLINSLNNGNGLFGDVCNGVSLCSNNVLEGPVEQCDDGNLINGDGCSDACLVESTPPSSGGSGSGSSNAVCGNNVRENPEHCDDGNLVNGDGCSATCDFFGENRVPNFQETLFGSMDVDRSNNDVYFVDSWEYSAIRKLTSDGAIITLAGKDSNYFNNGGDGPALQTSLSPFVNIDFYEDSLGNKKIYFIDGSKARVLDLGTNMITTIAGSSNGYQDGIGSSAKFFIPGGLVHHPINNELYVADRYNHCIRKIDLTTNQVSTFAGICHPNSKDGGHKDGALNQADFFEPYRLLFDDLNPNKLYVFERGNFDIREIDLTNGVVSTLIGGVASGALLDYQYGKGEVARIPIWNAITIRDGNIYFSDPDSGIQRIYKIDSNGVMSLYSGSGNIQNPTEGYLTDVILKGGFEIGSDSTGLYFISESNFYKATVEGRVVKLGQSSSNIGNPPKSDGLLFQTICGDGILQNSEQCDDGNLINVDSCTNQCVSNTPLPDFCGNGIISSSEQCDDGNAVSGDGCSRLCVSEFCGNSKVEFLNGEQCDDGNAVSGDGCSSQCFIEGPVNIESFARTSSPQEVYFDASSNSLYITQLDPSYILELSNNNLQRIIGTNSASPPFPRINEGNALDVYEFWPRGIQKFNSNYLVFLSGGNKLKFYNPLSGQVFVITGTISGFADGSGDVAKLYGWGLDVADLNNDGINEIYLADKYNHKIRKIEYTGPSNPSESDFDDETNWLVSTIAGGAIGFADGPSSSSQFNSPTGLVVDSQNNLIYVADTSNNRIRKIDLNNNVVSTLSGGLTGFIDGSYSSARFNRPYDIDLHPSGDIYVADYGNSLLRVLSNGQVSTIGTNSIINQQTIGQIVFGPNFADGSYSSARFKSPAGLDISNNGDVYVADMGNNAIRKIDTNLQNVETLVGVDGAPIYRDGIGKLNDVCGNGVIGVLEQCDDGDANNNNVCNNQCGLNNL